ncbi:type II toxin-antitoxin system HicB family antitoxin [Candidatus Uhrbacteria bacterium]|nr:type II toxin-antitoxin system HicB family antitoxin [Candidatus Uhrbacteria bacterium]
MLTEYINRQLHKAKYKLLDDQTYFGEIPQVRGVWASADTLEKCREELQEVFEDWIILKIRDRETIPGLTEKIVTKKIAMKQHYA